MFTINPFSELSQLIPFLVMQVFVVVMIMLVVAGTLMDIVHKKNVKYFFENANRAKKLATNNVNVGKKTSIVLKTVVSDVLIESAKPIFSNLCFVY